MRARSGHAALWGLAAAMVAAAPALAGPVLVYRDGPRYCPRDRGADRPAIAETEAIALARTLLPERFCGPAPRG